MENRELASSLHHRACEIAIRYQKTESELIDILQKIDQHRVYVNYGCGSLFEYSTSKLKLSESTAYNFITVSRKALEVPQLKEAIESLSLPISKARRIASVLTKDNQEKWIPMALGLSQRALEKEIARTNPEAIKSEKIKYIREDRLSLNLSVSEEVYNKIKRVQDLESQRTGKTISIEEALSSLTELYLEKKDPLQKATRAVAKPDSCRVKKDPKLIIPFAREPLLAKLRHQVYLRDKGRCVYKVPSGKTCANSRWIQIHHIIPISHGGTNDLGNLQTLCSGHHKMLHEFR